MTKEELIKTLEEYDKEVNRLFQENKKLKEEYITLEKDYGTCELENGKLRDKIKELEEENKRLDFCMQDTYDSANDTCGELQQRIDKAIKYIGSITDVKVRYFDYRNFEKESLHISHEELKRRIKEQHLEGHFIEIDRNDILKILKGEENE